MAFENIIPFEIPDKKNPPENRKPISSYSPSVPGPPRKMFSPYIPSLAALSEELIVNSKRYVIFTSAIIPLFCNGSRILFTLKSYLSGSMSFKIGRVLPNTESFACPSLCCPSSNNFPRNSESSANIFTSSTN